MGPLNCSSDIKATESNKKQKQQCVSNKKNRKKKSLRLVGIEMIFFFLAPLTLTESICSDQVPCSSYLWAVHWGNHFWSLLKPWSDCIDFMPCHGSTTPRTILQFGGWNCSCGWFAVKLHLLVHLLHGAGRPRRDLCAWWWANTALQDIFISYQHWLWMPRERTLNK